MAAITPETQREIVEAIEADNGAAVLALLSAKNIDMNSPIIGQATTLQYAAQQGARNVVFKLIEKGAVVNNEFTEMLCSAVHNPSAELRTLYNDVVDFCVNVKKYTRVQILRFSSELEQKFSQFNDAALTQSLHPLGKEEKAKIELVFALLKLFEQEMFSTERDFSPADRQRLAKSFLVRLALLSSPLGEAEARLYSLCTLPGQGETHSQKQSREAQRALMTEYFEANSVGSGKINAVSPELSVYAAKQMNYFITQIAQAGRNDSDKILPDVLKSCSVILHLPKSAQEVLPFVRGQWESLGLAPVREGNFYNLWILQNPAVQAILSDIGKKPSLTDIEKEVLQQLHSLVKGNKRLDEALNEYPPELINPQTTATPTQKLDALNQWMQRIISQLPDLMATQKVAGGHLSQVEQGQIDSAMSNLITRRKPGKLPADPGAFLNKKFQPQEKEERKPLSHDLSFLNPKTPPKEQTKGGRLPRRDSVPPLPPRPPAKPKPHSKPKASQHPAPQPGVPGKLSNHGSTSTAGGGAVGVSPHKASPHAAGQPVVPRKLSNQDGTFNAGGGAVGVSPHNPSQHAARQPVVRRKLSDDGGTFRAGGGTVGASPGKDFYSSLYYSLQRVHWHLTTQVNGYETISQPVLELLQSSLHRMKQNQNGQFFLDTSGKLVWDTLNPVGGFQVKSLLEPALRNSGTLAKAIEQHHEYVHQTYKSKLLAGDDYIPKEAKGKYYYQRDDNGIIYLRIKSGQTLTTEEMQEAERLLIVICQDMSGVVDVNLTIHNHPIFKKPEIKEAVQTVSAILFGVTLTPSAAVTHEDKMVHEEIRTKVETIKDPIVSPPKDAEKIVAFDDPNKKEEDLFKEVIENSSTLLMTAQGLVPRKELRGNNNDPQTKDLRNHYATVRALEETKPDKWGYLTGLAVSAGVLREMKEDPSWSNKQEVFVHVKPLMSADPNLRRDIEKNILNETETLSKELISETVSKWEKEKSRLQSKQNANTNTDSDEDTVARSDDEGDDVEYEEGTLPKSESEPLLEVSRRHTPRPQQAQNQQMQNQPLSVALGVGAPAAVPPVPQSQVPTTSTSTQVPAVIIAPRGWPSASTRPKTSIARKPQGQGISRSEHMVIDQATIASLRDQEEYERKNGPIGPRKPNGFVTAEVGDDGNCFYYALEDQLRLLKLEQYFHGVQPAEVHLELRQQVNPKSKSGDWAEEEDIGVAARKFNCCIAVYRTNTPDELGFECHYTNDNGEKKFTYDMNEIPQRLRNRIVRLIHTGNHFDSVRVHPPIPAGALQEAYRAPSASHSASPRASQSPSFFSSPTGSTGGEGKGNQNMKSAVSLKMTLSQNEQR